MGQEATQGARGRVGRGGHKGQGEGSHLLHNLLKHLPDFRQHMHFSLHSIIQLGPFRTEEAIITRHCIRTLDRANRIG
ncbi:hypothetical protein ABBQ32_007540 [Trebouxia sp. C0010 RCD-2024]